MEVTLPVRLLAETDHAAVTRLLDRHPIAAALIADRIEAKGYNGARGGARLYGYGHHDELHALCLAGANLVPLGVDAQAASAFAELVGGQGRQCSSIVGPADGVHLLWERLRPRWGAERALRRYQPLLWTDRPAPVAPDPRVRRCAREDLPQVFPAAVAMYTDEVGVSPLADASGGAAYRDRLARLVAAGRSYARFERGRVVFKAEVAILTRHTAQIQGVWVAPDRRGQGLATAGMAAVIADVLAWHAPTVSLYVNDYNVAARRAYARCGMREAGAFATVLF